ncbi:rhodanese-like domain-containing protein [Salinarimonas rosea]|uniref:rhodanese-like domain-containing protein n=1 Tax=Salinarimonas rosea TaxID=552063 RepID=UPI000403F35E
MLTFETGDAEALTREDVKRGLAAGDILLVDVREPEAFARGHIPGSVSHPLDAFEPARLPRDGRRLVFTCSAGVRSQHAAHAALAEGVSDVANYQGGIEDWILGGEPVARGEDAPAASGADAHAAAERSGHDAG